MAHRSCGEAPRNAREKSTDRKDYWHSHPYRPGKSRRDNGDGTKGPWR